MIFFLSGHSSMYLIDGYTFIWFIPYARLPSYKRVKSARLAGPSHIQCVNQAVACSDNIIFDKGLSELCNETIQQ